MSPTKQPRIPLRLEIEGERIEGSSVPEFYKSVLEYLLQTCPNLQEHVPFATGTKRYLIAKEPVHLGGSPFLSPIESGGFFMEGHKSRIGALKDVVRLLRKLGLSVRETLAVLPYSLDQARAEKIDSGGGLIALGCWGRFPRCGEPPTGSKRLGADIPCLILIGSYQPTATGRSNNG
jgi:hypothetical protein